MLVDLDTNQICSASLIRPHVLLTAAHCIPSKVELLSVFFDVDPLGGNATSAPVQILKTVVHPQYSKTADPQSVDLALVFLGGPAPASYKVTPLPSISSLAPEMMIDISGYGRNSLKDQNSFGRLHHAKVEILAVNDGFFEVDQSAGIGICDGDSGGAAFVEGVKGLTLVGVTKMAYDKYAQGQDSCLGVSQFTRVDKNLSWILQNL
jgi:trypsin